MIAQGYFSSPAGLIEIRADESAITSVRFVKTKQQDFEDDHPLISACQKQLQEYFAGNRTAFNLPLNARGTPFQQKVWKVLSEIPYGCTVSYQELAKMVDQPKATRAVGNANGKNPICLLIPCHRVIRSNGEVGGYAFGTATKEFLLKLEKH